MIPLPVPKRRNKRFNADFAEMSEAKRTKLVQKIAALSYFSRRNNDTIMNPSLTEQMNYSIIDKLLSVVKNSPSVEPVTKDDEEQDVDMGS